MHQKTRQTISQGEKRGSQGGGARPGRDGRGEGKAWSLRDFSGYDCRVGEVAAAHAAASSQEHRAMIQEVRWRRSGAADIIAIISRAR